MNNGQCDSQWYRLSSMQKAILLAGLSAPEAGLGVVQMVVDFHEPVECDLLLLAWRWVYSWHPVLRVRFDWPPGHEPRQQVQEQTAGGWQYLDWRSEADGRFDQRLLTWLAQDRKRGFALRNAAMMRHSLFLRPDGTHTLVWSYNEALLDSSSARRVLADVLETYHWLADDRHSTPPSPRPENFTDFPEYLKNEEWLKARNYWQELLRGHDFAPPLSIGPSGAREEHPTPQVIRAVWGGSIVENLRRLAGSAGVPFATVLQGAWALVLGRYLGLDEVVLGILCDGRQWRGVEHPDAVGMFMNTIPIRARFDETTPVTEWLRLLLRQTEASREHAHAPMDLMPVWLNLPAGQPLFEAVFHYESESATEGLRHRLPRWKRLEVKTEDRAGLPLLLSVTDGQMLRLEIEYDSRHFSRKPMERMLGHLHHVCEHLVRVPDATPFEIEMMDDLDRKAAQPVPLHIPVNPRGAGGTVLEHFSVRVAEAPDAVAVETRDQSLTYGQLQIVSFQVARWLRIRGIKDGQRIGICCGRSTWFVVALLASLKAGAVAVPLSPTTPARRRAFIAADANASVMLCDQESKSVRDGDDDGMEWVCLDAPDVEWRQQPAGPSKPPLPDTAAYVIYTSGSTGQPKGAENLHAGLVNEALCAAALFPVRAGDRVLQMANPGFDAVMEEVFVTLVSGATLVMRPVEMLDTFEKFHGLLGELRVNILDLTTAFWAQWVEWMHRHDRTLPESLRVMVVGGEKTQKGVYTIWQQQNQGRVRWINTYGPAEASIVTTAFVSPDVPGSLVPLEEIPVGRPLPGTFVRLLDPRLRPVPAGCIGELFIGGVGLGRGYVGRPDLTMAAFITDPEVPDGSGRLYRTGDFARLNENGDLEFQGRKDGQVKIHGVRVELESVEALVSSHPSVAETAVIPMIESGAVSGLAAYVVPRPGVSISTGELRTHLSNYLHASTCPRRWVVLDRMPLTANGKVDRSMLPPAVTDIILPGGEPTRETEFKLERAFAMALRRQRVGIDENFLQAGGDSLASMELIELAMREGIALRPEMLFSRPTIRSLACLVDEQKEGASESVVTEWSPLAPLRETGVLQPVFLVHSTPGDVMGYGNLVYHLGADVPCYGLTSRGLIDPSQCHHSIEEMAACYVEHMVKMRPEGPYHLAGWCYGGMVAYEMAQQLRRAGKTVGVLALIDCQAQPGHGFIGQLRYALRRVTCLVRMEKSLRNAYITSKLALALNALTGRKTSSGDESMETRLANREVVYKANLRAYHRYRCRDYPDPVHVFVCLETEAEDGAKIFDEMEGWPQHAPNAHYYRVHSGHRNVLKDRAVVEVASSLRDLILKSESTGKDSPAKLASK
jgi:amino acid adenylation domain-containing protein